MGLVLISVIFFSEFLACACLKNYGKNMENFPRSPKYDAKHRTIKYLLLYLTSKPEFVMSWINITKPKGEAPPQNS